MLVLARKLNESIVIGGRIIVKVLRINSGAVKLGIQAPPDLPVYREEVVGVSRTAKPGASRPGPARAPTAPARRGPPPSAPPAPAPSTPDPE